MSEKETVDLIIDATWIIPVVPRQKVINDGAIAVKNGKIVALGSTQDIEQKYSAIDRVSLPEQALMPGLVNAHGHAAMTLMRGFADDKALMEWLQNHIWPAEQQWVSDGFVGDGTQLAIAEMLRSGTTCFSDMYFFPENAAKAAISSGIRAQLNFPIMDFPTAWGSGPDEYFRKGIALHDQYRSHDTISIGFGPHAPYTVSDEPLKRIASYAEEMQATIQIHLHETQDEVESSIKDQGMRPIERLAKLGFLSPLVQCVHMTQVSDNDIVILQACGAHVVHCPESNLKLASGLCPADKLLKSDVNVCIGTDGAASNNNLDMFSELRTAALIGKVTAGDAAALSAMTALEMATINGAKAMGLADQIGSLEVGKCADITAVDLSDLSHQPLYDPISHLVYAKIGHKVSNVWVNGKVLLKHGELQTIDSVSVRRQTLAWQKKLAGTQLA